MLGGYCICLVVEDYNKRISYTKEGSLVLFTYLHYTQPGFTFVYFPTLILTDLENRCSLCRLEN